MQRLIMVSLLQYILLIYTGVVVTGNPGFPQRLPATVWMSALSIPSRTDYTDYTDYSDYKAFYSCEKKP